MEEINVDVFKKEWDKICNKLKIINDIPKLNGTGEKLLNIDIDVDGLTHIGETYRNGDFFTYVFSVSWEELNKPIGYFIHKYSTEIKEDEIKRQQEKENAEEVKKNRELEKLKRLQIKYNIT
jgi:hypothetical protein